MTLVLKTAIGYETDFVAWAEQQASLLKAGELAELDVENLAEEIESLGRSDRRALKSQVTRVILHLLKWHYQPERRSGSWRGSIAEGRVQILALLQDSPSLKPYLLEILAACYDDASLIAIAETTLPDATFPVSCPYTIEQLIDTGFLPGNGSIVLAVD